MRTGENVYVPESPVVVVSSAPVPSLVRVMVAPLRTAPDASVTVPEMLPVSTCAGRRLALKSKATIAKAQDNRPIEDDSVFPLITILLRASLGPAASEFGEICCLYVNVYIYWCAQT